MMKSLFGSAVMSVFLAGTFGAFVSPARAVTISSGDLIRGTTFSAVYYMGADGFRYVFPNEKTYKTWYSDSSGNADFSDVVMISDAELADIQMGGNVTYRPGVKMLKIDTDPRVYVVTEGGVLYHVDSESVASSLYGSTWNKQIDDVPDGYFSNYRISGKAISTVEGWMPYQETDSVTSINEDKTLSAPEEINITNSGYSPIDVTVCAGQNIKFTNDTNDVHTATADDLTWGTGTLQPGETFIRKFKTPGVDTFYDGYDSTNTGAIYVEDCPVF